MTQTSQRRLMVLITVQSLSERVEWEAVVVQSWRRTLFLRRNAIGT